MSAKKSPLNSEISAEALMYEDVSLTRKYSVIEIAMLAAGCRGETRAERIDDAVEILALVERYALVGKETRCRIRDRKQDKRHGYAESSEVGYALIQDRFLKALEIRHASTRDKKTGKIKVASLVGLAYEAATGGKTASSEAMRRYNKWVEEEAGEEAVAVQAFKARFESGTKPAVVNSDDQALQLGMQFIRFLEDCPKREPKKIIQSKKAETKGQIVSPKNRGSDIAEGDEEGLSKNGNPRKRGQYKPKRVAALDEQEDSHQSSRTRMHGNGPD